MKKENPNISDTDLQKKFRRYQFEHEKREEFKSNVRYLFSLKGLKEDKLEEEVENYFDQLKEQKNDKNFHLDFEIDDYLEGYRGKMIQDKVSDLEEPISEE